MTTKHNNLEAVQNRRTRDGRSPWWTPGSGTEDE